MENQNEDGNEPLGEAVTSQQNGVADTATKTEDGENFNPDKMPDELKDIFLVDAIGDTLYSKRFVLKTLLNLNKIDGRMSEEFEKDMCTLWDMTIEKDVIKLLLENNVLEIFSGIIQISDDQRLVEILVGIIGNMCSIAQTRDALCQQPDVMIPIIELVSCSDSLILVQLMRLFHTCLVFENSGDEYIWFQHFRCADQFIEKFAYVLSNSMNTTLLVHAYEALNAICTKFAIIEVQPEILDSSGFRDVFVKPLLVSGVIEAFNQMLPDMPKLGDSMVDGETSQPNNSHIIDDDMAAPTKRTLRIMNLFLDINVILSQYDASSQKCYQPFLPELMKCVSKCLQPLCSSIYLLPLSSNEQIIIENVNELIQALDDPFDEKCFRQMITIWWLIEQHLAKAVQTNSEWENDDADEEEVSGIDVNMTILEYLTRTSKNATIEQIVAGIEGISEQTIVSLCNTLSAGNSEDDIKACTDKFKAAARLIWNIDIHVPEDSGEDGGSTLNSQESDDQDDIEPETTHRQDKSSVDDVSHNKMDSSTVEKEKS